MLVALKQARVSPFGLLLPQSCGFLIILFCAFPILQLQLRPGAVSIGLHEIAIELDGFGEAVLALLNPPFLR